MVEVEPGNAAAYCDSASFFLLRPRACLDDNFRKLRTRSWYVWYVSTSWKLCTWTDAGHIARFQPSDDKCDTSDLTRLSFRACVTQHECLPYKPVVETTRQLYACPLAEYTVFGTFVKHTIRGITAVVESLVGIASLR